MLKFFYSDKRKQEKVKNALESAVLGTLHTADLHMCSFRKNVQIYLFFIWQEGKFWHLGFYLEIKIFPFCLEYFIFSDLAGEV